MSVFYSWVHGEWIGARYKEIAREPLRGSRDLFIPCPHSFLKYTINTRNDLVSVQYFTQFYIYCKIIHCSLLCRLIDMMFFFMRNTKIFRSENVITHASKHPGTIFDLAVCISPFCNDQSVICSNAFEMICLFPLEVCRGVFVVRFFSWYWTSVTQGLLFLRNIL